MVQTPVKEDKKPRGSVRQGTKRGFVPCTTTRVIKADLHGRSLATNQSTALSPKRKVLQGGSQAFKEEEEGAELVMVTTPAGQRIYSGDGAFVSCYASEPA